MSQFGCVVAFACSLALFGHSLHFCKFKALKAPPEAVKMILRNAPGGKPACIETTPDVGIGVNLTPFFTAILHNRRTTSD